RRTPQPGRWKFVLFINQSISGAQTTEPFNGTIAFNTGSVQASGAPSGATLTAGMPQTVTITVTNTGNTTKDFFVDPRLITTTQLSANAFASDQFSIPI